MQVVSAKMLFPNLSVSPPDEVDALREQQIILARLGRALVVVGAVGVGGWRLRCLL